MNLLNQVLVITFFLFTNCSTEEQEYSCFKGENRKVVGTFNNVDGLVLAPSINNCQTIYTLTGGPDLPERNLRLLAPCNLPTEYKQDSLKIIYSGYLFETFENEDLCAQSFEITEIKKK